MSLVLQLQEEALKPDTDVGNLLHKALVVASKLNLRDFETWVRAELNGYTTKEVPSYRRVRGRLMARTPWQTAPAVFPWPEIQEKISTHRVKEPIAEISELLARSNEGVQIVWSDQIYLRNAFKVNAEFFIEVPSPQLQAVLIAVKTQIIDWSLNLERDGITGDGFRFSETDKNRASTHATQLTPPVINAYFETMNVETLNQTNQNQGDVNNAIQPSESKSG
jgi:hypothetical protein